VVQEFFDRADRRDPGMFDVLAEDFVNHAAGPQGRDGMRRTAGVLDHDLGPLRQEVHHVVADGDMVVVHLTLHGTHRASTMPLLQGVPVSGAVVAWTFTHLFRVAGEEIVEHWATRDDVGLLDQVGAWPPGAGAVPPGPPDPGGRPDGRDLPP
jgi:lactoylglutathione lyase